MILVGASFRYKSKIDNLEQKKVEEFQEYIDENQVKITDSKKIRSWIKTKNIREFIISKGTKIYFDNRYEEDIFPGSIKNNTFNYLYSINFALVDFEYKSLKPDQFFEHYLRLIHKKPEETYKGRLINSISSYKNTIISELQLFKIRIKKVHQK